MNCARCGTELPANARFCLSCGAPAGGGASP
ncbi:MAG: zinc-ribbon domain-containing protein, partial [Candidatus Lutacidiplasmatales archaeon]